MHCERPKTAPHAGVVTGGEDPDKGNPVETFLEDDGGFRLGWAAWQEGGDGESVTALGRASMEGRGGGDEKDGSMAVWD